MNLVIIVSQSIVFFIHFIIFSPLFCVNNLALHIPSFCLTYLVLDLTFITPENNVYVGEYRHITQVPKTIRKYLINNKIVNTIHFQDVEVKIFEQY